MLKSALTIVAFIGFGVAVAWVYFEPQKYDAWVAAIAALVVFLGLFVPDKIHNSRARTQTQRTGGGSTGIQAGGNLTININSKKD